MSADTQPGSWKLTRREFIALTAGASTVWVIGTSLGTLGRFICAQRSSNPDNSYLKDIPFPPGSGEFVWGVDPMDPDRKVDLYDLGSSSPILRSGGVKDAVDQLTQSNEGIISYPQFMRELQAQIPLTAFLGEPHFEDGDKVAHREIIDSVLKAAPDKPVIVALGRAKPEDDPILYKFIFKLKDMNEKKALEWLIGNSSLGDHSFGADYSDRGAKNGQGYEFGRTLMMLRKFGIRTVGLAVDRGAVSVQEYVSLTSEQEADEFRLREQRAAEIIAKLERDNPRANIVSIMGRPHIERGQNGSGTTPKLERMHSEQGISRPVVTVNFIDTVMSDRRFWNDFRIATAAQLPTSNFSMVVKEPAFSSEQYVDGLTQNTKHLFPGCDYLMMRVVRNPSSN